MALKNKQEVKALADNLTKCADSMHSRIMKAINNKEIDLPKAQLMFQDETILRQRANSLYIDAANCIVADLEEAQEKIMGVIDTAKEKIETIKKIASIIDLFADLLVLAGAVYAAKPASILTALKAVKDDLKEL